MIAPKRKSANLSLRPDDKTASQIRYKIERVIANIKIRRVCTPATENH